MKFLDIFTPIEKGSHGLNDAAIYQSIKYKDSFIPIWGGKREHTKIEKLVSVKAKTKYNDPIKIFESPGIIISLDGSAGSMTCKSKYQKFALNHHAGFFRVSQKGKEIVLPEYFSLFYQKHLQNLSISEGSKTLTVDQLYRIDIDLPSIDEQTLILKEFGPILTIKQKVDDLLQKIDSIRNRILSLEYSKFQVKNYPISKILDCMNGNSGLTEEEIYSQIKTKGERYQVLSSSTEKKTKLGEIPICDIKGKRLRVFENKEGVLIIRNGKAGRTFYLRKGKYTINDHAYILYLIDNIPFDISLKWLMYGLKNTFLEFSSSSDNGTWNKTGFFKNVYIDIPTIEDQNILSSIYEEIDNLYARIDVISEKLNDLLTRQVSTI